MEVDIKCCESKCDVTFEAVKLHPFWACVTSHKDFGA